MSFNENQALETYKSLISVSTEGFKVLLLINGGAVVALLTYLGQSPRGGLVAPHAWAPMACFVAGVCACAVAFIGAYATQLVLFNEVVGNTSFVGPKHTTCLGVTAFFVVVSLLCFVAGAFTGVNVLAHHGGSTSLRGPEAQTQVAPATDPASATLSPK